MSKTKPKLIIIDGNALIHRSFHALPPTLRTKSGQVVNAVYGFTSFLLKALNEFKPEFVVLTLDKKGPTFRHEEYAAYKATRVKAPDELYEQIPLVKKVAEAFRIPIFELDGYEADDLIGAICEQTQAEKNLERIIITGDLDTLQLVDEKTKVYTMSRGLADSVLYSAEQIKARYNLNPDQIIDYKALRGDPSDNIPGVKGIGEKNASDLLVDFKDLDGVYQAVKKNNPKIRERIAALLKEHHAEAYLSQKLATIDRQAPLKFSLPDSLFLNFELEAVMNIFQEFEFRSLLGKVKDLRDNLGGRNLNKLVTDADEVDSINNPDNYSQKNEFKNPLPPSSQKITNYQLLDTPKKFTAFLKELKKKNNFTINLETSSTDPLSAQLLGFSFSWQDYEAYFLPNTLENIKKLQPILENQKIKKNGYNLKLTWRLLKNLDIELQGLNFDIFVAAYMLNPGDRRLDLDSLAFTELSYERNQASPIKERLPQQLALTLEAPNLEQQSFTACEKVDLIQRLSGVLATRLDQANLRKLYDEIEKPLIPVLGMMENNGIKLNSKKIKELSQAVGQKLAQLEKTIHRLAKTKFNINSPKQLREILFEKLAIPTDNIKKNKTGFSTGEEELNKLSPLHPIITEIQSYRELNKLQTTYLQALPEMVDPQTNRLHTNFNQTITATGRLSSTEPNLQNIPIRTTEGQKIRTAFVASPDWELAGFDYSQIELRLAAHMANDKKMISAFQNNLDIHTATAAEINNVSLEEVTKTMRREAKAINFGILYGQGPHGLSQSAGIPYWQANEFIKKYFDAYPEIKKMVAQSIKEAREKGYAITLFGRKRPLTEINSTIPAVRKSAERMAINTPIQGTAADLIKIAMIQIAALIKNHDHDIKLLLQVHDELIFEIKKNKINHYAPQIKNIMERALKLKVPIVVDEHRGQNWGDLK